MRRKQSGFRRNPTDLLLIKFREVPNAAWGCNTAAGRPSKGQPGTQAAVSQTQLWVGENTNHYAQFEEQPLWTCGLTEGLTIFPLSKETGNTCHTCQR